MYEFRPISKRVAKLKERYRNFPFTLDTERALIVTETYKKHKHKPAALKKAQSLHDVCEQGIHTRNNATDYHRNKDY